MRRLRPRADHESMKHKSIGKQITTIDITSDKIIGRGSIPFILRYVEKIKLFHLLDRQLGNVGAGLDN